MKSARVFLIYFSLAIVLYFPSWQSGLTWDFIGWLMEYKTEGAQGFMHLFNDRGLHPLYQLAFFGLYKLFGAHPFGWFIVFLTLHVCNSTLSFILFSRLFKGCNIINGGAIAFFGALFFLVSPYQTEVVVWKATIHYLITTACILSGLIFSLEYAQKDNLKYLACVFLFYFIGLFSLEIAISLPFMLLLFIFLPQRLFGKITTIQFLLRIILPQIFMIPVFFLLSKLLLGRWVAHYGAAHLNFSDVLVIGNFNRYLVKYLIFTQFFDYYLRTRIYEFFSKPVIAHLFLSLYVLTGVLLWYSGKWHANNRSKALFVLCGMCFAGMMTTVNLYFNYIINIENDRFGYLGSVFILMTFAFLIFQLNFPFRFLILGVFTFFSIKFLEINIGNWEQSAIIINKLTANFNRFKSNKIYLLNTPDNFHGANVFRNFGVQAPVAEDLFVIQNIDELKQVKDVLYYNMETINDSVNVEQTGEHSLKVSFAQWGNWWWRHGIGASDFENDDFTVKLVDGSYNITFKNRAPNDIMLYQCGTEWRIFKWLGPNNSKII